MTARRFASASLALVLIGWACPATSQPTPAERALATTLFREAKQLMSEKRYSEACPKLAESQRLDPGGGTLLNLAICHEEEGKIASAWAEFNEAVAVAKRDGRADREQLARERADKLEPTLPRITLVVPVASDLPDLQLVLDDVVVRRAAWGIATPVDPGRHVLRASAPGREAWRWEGDVVASQTVKIELPPLALAPTPPPAAVEQPPPAIASPPPIPPTQPFFVHPRPDVTPPKKRIDTHDGQLGAFARVDIDGQLRGAIVAVGGSYGLTRYFDVAAAALLGGHPGASLGGTLYLLTGPFKPAFAADVPVHFEDGIHPGVHVRGGLQWDPHAHFGALVAAGVEYFPNAPAGFDEVVFVPSIGVQGRL